MAENKISEHFTFIYMTLFKKENVELQSVATTLAIYHPQSPHHQRTTGTLTLGLN
jgi:hypothetical protein